LEPGFAHGFFRSYVNDLICIPFWVPIMLWLIRRLGLREDDSPPQPWEILMPLVVWSVLFENALPRFFPNVTVADPYDVLAYVTGAAVATLTWMGRTADTRVEGDAGTTVA
jgi:hypothetical protein